MSDGRFDLPAVIKQYPIEAAAFGLVVALWVLTTLPSAITVGGGSPGTYGFDTLQIIFALLRVIGLSLPAVAIVLYIVLGYVPEENRPQLVRLGMTVLIGFVVAGAMLIFGLVTNSDVPRLVTLAAWILFAAMVAFVGFVVPLWSVGRHE